VRIGSAPAQVSRSSPNGDCKEQLLHSTQAEG
jgi:hypothetical protein